jgi:putative redox protein
MKNSSVTVKWTGNLQFIGTDSNKHSIVMSSRDEANNTGVSPSQLLLIALGACSAYDVVVILQKKRLQLTGLDIVVNGEQETDPPYTYRHIHVAYKLKGQGLTEKAVGQAVNLSLEKYCSVAATVSGQADISCSFEILEDGGNNPEAG